MAWLFTDLQIRNKLILLLALPFIGLLYFSSDSVLQKVRMAREMRSLQTLSALAVKMSALVHETQKERGLSALFLGSQGMKSAAELQTQRSETDKKHTDVQELLNEFDVSKYRAELKASLEHATASLQLLGAKRQGISALSLPADQAIGFYTDTNALLLNVIAAMAALSRDVEISTMVSAYVNFLQGKERAGIERAILSNTFAADKFAPGMFHKFSAVVAEQHAYTNVFLSFATAAQQQFYQEQLRHPAVEEASRLRSVAFAAANTGAFGIDAAHWFTVQTEKINILKEVENTLAQGLMAHVSSLQHRVWSAFMMSLMITIPLLLTSLLVAYLIARSIVRPLRKIGEAAGKIAAGDIHQDIDHQSRDEIGALAQSFRGLLAYIKGIASAAEALSTGDLAVQINAKSAQDTLSQNVIRVIETLRHLMDETTGLIQAAKEGRLNERSDAARFQGGYRELIQGINKTLDAVTAPVNEATAVLETVAARDLTARMEGDYQGDHAKIKNALNLAVSNLDQGLLQVAVGAEQVARASEHINTGSQTLAQSASEQASTLEEVSSSLQEMAAMTTQNTASAREARRLSEGARSSAEDGMKSMQRLSQASDRIKTSANATAEIVKTIDEIAFQTSLLALNAAVEAARAGDAGKGFAVVAGEVRHLAIRSAEAAKNTANLIEEAVKNAEGGVAINAEVLGKLQEINAQIDQMSQVMAQVTAASEQQGQSVEQINTAIEQMNQVTQQTAANAEESASAAEELAGQAAEMQQMVGSFQLTAAHQDHVAFSNRMLAHCT